jgi:hypothetical protein
MRVRLDIRSSHISDIEKERVGYPLKRGNDIRNKRRGNLNKRMELGGKLDSFCALYYAETGILNFAADCDACT